MSTPAILKPQAVTEGDVYERPFVRVVFQRGLPQSVGVNGCRVDAVLEVAKDRLEAYQMGPLSCEENEEAIAHIRLALAALERRTRRRMEQGVINTMTRHVSRTEDEHDDFSATGS